MRGSRASVVETIRKLLRLARSANAHEGAVAKERADSLMRRYGITVTLEDHRQVVHGAAGEFWRERLLYAAGRAHRCRVVRSTDGERAVIVGQAADVAEALRDYAHLVAEVLREGRVAWDAFLREERLAPVVALLSTEDDDAPVEYDGFDPYPEDDYAMRIGSDGLLTLSSGRYPPRRRVSEQRWADERARQRQLEVVRAIAPLWFRCYLFAAANTVVTKRVKPEPPAPARPGGKPAGPDPTEAEEMKMLDEFVSSTVRAGDIAMRAVKDARRGGEEVAGRIQFSWRRRRLLTATSSFLSPPPPRPSPPVPDRFNQLELD